MAINHLGKQVVKETQSGTYDGTDLSPADSNEGLVVKLKGPNTAWQDGQAKYEKTAAAADVFAGVVLNVSGTTLTGSTEPSLDPRGTSPGGRTVTVGTRGIFLLKNSAAVTTGDVGNAVVAAASGQVTATSSPGTNPVIGRVVAADDNTNNLILVELA